MISITKIFKLDKLEEVSGKTVAMGGIAGGLALAGKMIKDKGEKAIKMAMKKKEDILNQMEDQ